MFPPITQHISAVILCHCHYSFRWRLLLFGDNNLTVSNDIIGLKYLFVKRCESVMTRGLSSLRVTLCLPFSHIQTSWCMESSTEGCSGFCLMKRRLGRPRQHMNQQYRMCHPPPPYLSSSYIFSPGMTGSVCSLNIFSDNTELDCEHAIFIHLYPGSLCDSKGEIVKIQRQETL